MPIRWPAWALGDHALAVVGYLLGAWPFYGYNAKDQEVRQSDTRRPTL